MRKLGLAVSVLLLTAFSASSAHARASAKDRARRHFAKGFAYYQNGDYLKAVKELKTAYALRPVPVVLFYIGKTFQSAGLVEEAARALWQFLDEATLNNPKREQAKAALKEMGKPMRAPATGIGPGPGPGPGPDVKPRERPRETPRPRRRPKPRVKPGQIIHEPMEDARPGHPLSLEAELPEDFGDWARLYLYYRPKGFEKFFKKPMKPDRRDVYHGCIPKRHLKGTSIQYYIEAVGRTGKRKAGSGTASLPNIIALSPEAPLQPGGRLKGCPDEADRRPGPGAGPGEGPGAGVTPPPGGGAPGTDRLSKRRLMLYGFIATGAVTVASFVTGAVLSVQARSKAQEMANAGVNGPVLVFDGEVENIEKQGKALDTGAIFCYVLGGVALAGAAYLGYEYFFGMAPADSEEKPDAPDTKVSRWRITPTIGPQTWGLSGQFQF